MNEHVNQDEALTVVVSECDNEFSIDDLRFHVEVSHDNTSWTLYLDGGYGLDDDGDWREMPDVEIAHGQFGDGAPDTRSDTFAVTVTPAHLEAARRYRRLYPAQIPGPVTTVTGIAQQFNISEQAVRKAIHAGRLPARKSGRTWLIAWNDAAQVAWRPRLRKASSASTSCTRKRSRVVVRV